METLRKVRKKCMKERSSNKRNKGKKQKKGVKKK